MRITDVRKRLIKNLSKGYRQRVGMSQALVGNLELLIFDEPTVGLDPRQIIEIRKLINGWATAHRRALQPHPQRGLGRVRAGHHHQSGADRRPGHPGEPLPGHQLKPRLSVRIAGSPVTRRSSSRAIEGVQYVESLGTKEPDTVDSSVEAPRTGTCAGRSSTP